LIARLGPPGNKKDLLLDILDGFHALMTEKSAHLLGAIYNTEKDPYLPPISPLHRGNYERAEENLRAALGDEAFESAFAQGQKLSLDEALDLVLKSLEEVDE